VCSTYSSSLVINICIQGKTLCSPCIIYFSRSFRRTHVAINISRNTSFFPGTWFGKRKYRTMNWSTGLGIGLFWDNSVECRLMDWLTVLRYGLCWDNSVQCRTVDWLTGLRIPIQVDFPLHHRFQTGSGTHPSSYPTVMEGYFSVMRHPKCNSNHYLVAHWGLVRV